MTVLSVAMAIALVTTLGVVARWPHYRCVGDTPLPTLAFMAILFTSGLDVGLIMFPLIDFETYAAEADYQFASPLVVEFGFWAGLVWGFYVLTTLYFCAIEPRVRLLPTFEWKRRIENRAEAIVVSNTDGIVLVIMAACAADSQSHKRFAHHINLIVSDIQREVATVEGLGTNRQQSSGHQVSTPLGIAAGGHEPDHSGACPAGDQGPDGRAGADCLPGGRRPERPDRCRPHGMAAGWPVELLRATGRPGGGPWHGGTGAAGAHATGLTPAWGASNQLDATQHEGDRGCGGQTATHQGEIDDRTHGS